MQKTLLFVGFSAAQSPDASCTVAAAKAGLPKQASKSAPLELAPDLPLGVLATSPREREKKVQSMISLSRKQAHLFPREVLKEGLTYSLRWLPSALSLK